jgi:hypothetical protein
VTEATAALSYAVRPAVVGRYLGQLALVAAVSLLAPLGVAAAHQDLGFAGRLAQEGFRKVTVPQLGETHAL